MPQALKQFEEEEKEWEKLSLSASSQADGVSFQNLPAAGSAVSSTHSVMQELSIQDRNLVCR